jgi:hypothetical protein
LQQESTYGFIRLEGADGISDISNATPGRRGEAPFDMNKRLRTRLFAWWYFAIAAGFTLLGINRWMLGERAFLIVLRFGIAAGFLILGVLTRRTKS